MREQNVSKWTNSFLLASILIAAAAPGCSADQTRRTPATPVVAPAPAAAPVAAAPARAPAPAPYIAPGLIDMTRLLPPPSPAGSAAERRELDELLELQTTSSPERRALAEADGEINLTRFANILGPKLKPETLPVVMGFLGQASRSSGSIIGITKDCWLRPRPFVTEPRLQPPGNLKASAGARRGAPRAPVPLGAGSPCVESGPASDYSYAYPSGHSTWGAMTAMLLAEMIPEKRAELYARGWEYGDSRMVGGVHYRSDVEAGRTQAAIVIGLMMANPRFHEDLARARDELRTALGYPPLGK